MVASFARAFMASHPSPTIFRAAGCSRSTGVGSIGRTTRRWASVTATQLSPELESGAPAKPDDLSESKSQNPNADQPLFTTLKDTVSPETLKAITVRPFTLTHMSPVQAAVLPLLPGLAKPYNAQNPGAVRDLLVKARTGTGKTLAFLVPAIEARINAVVEYGKQAVKESGLVNDKTLEVRAQRIFARSEVGTLVLSPTRELATQIANEAVRLSHHHKEFEVRLFVGGNSKRLQMRDWMKGRRDLVVATPGRLRDVLENEPDIAQGIAKTRTLILDEADTLLDMGFRDDIDAIVKRLPKTPQRQTMLFSATVSPAIREVARATLDKNHTFINCVSENSSPVHAHIPQYHTVLPSAEHQIPHVLRLLAQDQLQNQGTSKVMVFLPTTKMTQLFATFLRQLAKTTLPSGRSTHVYEIHSKRAQHSRETTAAAFRADTSGAAILVSSDVSARGVDYPGVTRVIQVGIPSGPDLYVHRVGRTGRGENVSGRADLVLLPWEIGFVSWQLTDIPLKPLTVSELANQVKALAEKHDADPDAAFAQVKMPKPTPGHARPALPQKFAPCAETLEKLPQTVEAFLAKVDEAAVGETMASLLGYYFPKSGELRVQKGVVVQGCKDWAVEACGLATPPFISEMFLRRLGMSDGGSQRSGRSSYDEPRRSSGNAAWMGRGQQRLKDLRRSRGHSERSGEFGEESRGFGQRSRGSQPDPERSYRKSRSGW